MISVQTEDAVQEARSETWGWFTPTRFGIFLAALVFIEFPDVLLGFRTFVFRDFGLFGYPLAHYYRESFWRGELPLWNPLSNLGIPFLAQWNTMVLYPPSLFYLLFPLPWSLPTFCLAHLWLAGFGMYLLVFRWTGNRFAAAVAGIAFAFNGFSLNSLMWPNYISALAWMPLMVLSSEDAWREGGRKTIVAAIVGALQILAGSPEVILFTWVFLAVLFLISLQRETWLSRLKRFAIVGLIATGLTAVQLLPFLDLVRHSHRGAEFAELAGAWSMPPWGWANFIVPLFRTFKSSSGLYFQQDQSVTSSYYAGIAIFALAVAAVWHVRNPRVWILGVVALMSIVFALGDSGYAYRWMRLITPQLGFMRYPVKFVIFAIFALPLLAAYGVALYARLESGSNAKALRSLSIIGAGLICLAAGIVTFSKLVPFPYEDWLMTLRSGVIRGIFLLASLATMVALSRALKPRLQILLQFLLLIFVWLDFLTHTPRQNPTVEPSIYAPFAQTPSVMPRPVFGESRVLPSLEAKRVFHKLGPTNLLEGYLGRRLALEHNCNLLESVPSVDGYYALYLIQERAIHDRLHAVGGRPYPELAQFLGVSQINAAGNIMEWEMRGDYLPLITAGQRPVFAGAEATLDGLLNTNFAPREIVYLPLEAQRAVTVTNRSEVEIVSRKLSAHRIRVTIKAREPCLVTVAQTYYHPWRAYVDGRRIPLWRANHAFQALQVRPEQREIELVYQDRIFLIGFILSVITLIGCGIAWRIYQPSRR